MDRLDHRIRRGRQEAIDEMRSEDRLELGAPVAFELGPDAGEGEKRPILNQREPNDILGPVYLSATDIRGCALDVRLVPIASDR